MSATPGSLPGTVTVSQSTSKGNTDGVTNVNSVFEVGGMTGPLPGGSALKAAGNSALSGLTYRTLSGKDTTFGDVAYDATTGLLVYGAFKGAEKTLNGAKKFLASLENQGHGITPSQSPSEIARSSQGKGSYPGVDKYRNITIKEDTILYRGEPNETEYFTTESAIKRSGYDAKTLFEGLQVEKSVEHGYRPNMQGYKATKDLGAAFGLTKNNPVHGDGGLPQIFVPNAKELIQKGSLVPVDNIPLKK